MSAMMVSDDKDAGTENIIRIRGLPWGATNREIYHFFNGVKIVNGENGIHLVNQATHNTKPLGEVYIELASYADLQRAKTFHEKKLGTQYIEVFETSFHEFQIIMNKQRGAQDKSPSSTECHNNIGGGKAKKRNIQPIGNNRMHPYARNGGSNFVRGPNKADCYIVDAPALPSDEAPPPPQQDETLIFRVEALESLVDMLRINNQNLENRVDMLETAAGRCFCGVMDEFLRTNPRV